MASTIAMVSEPALVSAPPALPTALMLTQLRRRLEAPTARVGVDPALALLVSAALVAVTVLVAFGGG